MGLFGASLIFKPTAAPATDVLDWFVSANGASNFNLSANTVDDWLDQKGSIDISETLTNRPEWDTVNGVDFASEFLQSSGIGSFGGDTAGELVIVMTTYNILANSTFVGFGHTSVGNKYMHMFSGGNEIVNLNIRDVSGNRFFALGTTIGISGDKVMITGSSNGTRYQGTINNANPVTGGDGAWLGDLDTTLDSLAAGAYILGGSPFFISNGLKLHFAGYKSGSEMTTQERTDLFNFLDSEFTIP